MKFIISANTDKDNVFLMFLLLANHTIQSCGSGDLKPVHGIQIPEGVGNPITL